MVKNLTNRELRYYKRNFNTELKQHIFKNKLYNSNKYLLNYYENYSWNIYNKYNDSMIENNNLKEYINYLEELFNASDMKDE